MIQKSLEERISLLLQQKHMTVTTAESCTGGLIVSRLINVSGISQSLNEGYITYSNTSKERILGVRHETLETYGAVSRQTAQEMALGAQKAACADISIVSTGIAGPGGGTEEKPVGLVYLGCCCLGDVTVEKHLFSGDRMQVRESAAEAALSLLEKILKKESR